MSDPEKREAFEQLVRDKLPHAQMTFVDEGDDLLEIIQGAIDAGATHLVAAGGDGTVNAVASHLVETSMVLGVLPMGTLNHFSGDLGIPEEMAEALDVIANGHERQVDVGVVNDRIFLNNSGLGLYPDMVHHRERRQRRGLGKWPAVMLEGWRAFMRYRQLRLHIQVNGKQLNRRTPAVFVGNNEYLLEGGLAATRESLCEGELCLYVPHSQSRLGLIWFSVRALVGTLKSDRAFDKLLTHTFTIRSSHRMLRVSLDGEVTPLETPLEYRIKPASLRVLVPAALPTDDDAPQPSKNESS